MKKIALLAALLLSGCTSGPSIIGGAGRLNYAADSRLGPRLPGSAQEALYPVFLGAMERGRKGVGQSWGTGPANGTVVPGDYRIGNLKPDPRTLLPADPGLDLGYSFETELGLHALTGNANLRAGPAADARILATLEGGAAVDVVGKTVGRPFYLVAIGGRVKGYVHESLAKKAPGTELELAGGPVRRAALCRDYSQTLTLFGDTDRWAGVACDRGDGWRLEPRDPTLPNILG